MPEIDLLNQAVRTAAKIGIEKTYHLLQEAEYSGIVIDNKQVEFVLMNVSQIMSINIHEILHGNGRKNERKMAIGFSAYYLQDKFKFEQADVARHLNKSSNTVHRYTKLVRNLSTKRHYEANRQFLEFKTKLDDIFIIK